jgi:hypothetical protein
MNCHPDRSFPFAKGTGSEAEGSVVPGGYIKRCDSPRGAPRTGAPIDLLAVAQFLAGQLFHPRQHFILI